MAAIAALRERAEAHTADPLPDVPARRDDVAAAAQPANAVAGDQARPGEAEAARPASAITEGRLTERDSRRRHSLRFSSLFCCSTAFACRRPAHAGARDGGPD